MNISFVILHYQNIDVTTQCVDSLKSLEGYSQVQLVIVDNASPNNSGDVLKKLYNDDDKIHIICNTENIGFAKGNNIGYKYAKNKLGSDIIVVMNNDVLILQNDFLKRLEEISFTTKADLIAPDIVNLVDFHQNPFRKKPLTINKIKKMYYYNLFLRAIFNLPIINSVFLKMLTYRNKQKNNSLPIKKEENILYNIVPHGSCIIYSGNWIENEDFAFLPETFMYFEEDILYEYIRDKRYEIVYNPNIQVKHIEDASIDASVDKKINKRKFIAKHFTNSLQVLLKMRSHRS